MTKLEMVQNFMLDVWDRLHTIETVREALDNFMFAIGR